MDNKKVTLLILVFGLILITLGSFFNYLQYQTASTITFTIGAYLCGLGKGRSQ